MRGCLPNLIYLQVHQSFLLISSQYAKVGDDCRNLAKHFEFIISNSKYVKDHWDSIVQIWWTYPMTRYIHGIQTSYMRIGTFEYLSPNINNCSTCSGVVHGGSESTEKAHLQQRIPSRECANLITSQYAMCNASVYRNFTFCYLRGLRLWDFFIA
jgi:hypothetical protein